MGCGQPSHTSELLRSLNEPLQVFLVCQKAISIPNCDVSQDTLYGAAVNQQSLLQMVPPQHAKEVESLLGFLTTVLVLVVHEKS